MKIDFNTETTYGDDGKYIKTRIKTYKDSIITNFYNKSGTNTRRKSSTQMFMQKKRQELIIILMKN